MNSYAVIYDGRIVATSRQIAVARKHARGVAGRTIIRHDVTGERHELRDFRGGTFFLRGVEIPSQPTPKKETA